jgi:hypothetical protein
MEHCQVCRKTADHLQPCEGKKQYKAATIPCPVAAYYEKLERERLGDPEKKTGIYGGSGDINPHADGSTPGDSIHGE